MLKRKKNKPIIVEIFLTVQAENICSLCRSDSRSLAWHDPGGRSCEEERIRHRIRKMGRPQSSSRTECTCPQTQKD
jgi:hypothetical protein